MNKEIKKKKTRYCYTNPLWLPLALIASLIVATMHLVSYISLCFILIFRFTKEMMISSSHRKMAKEYRLKTKEIANKLYIFNIFK